MEYYELVVNRWQFSKKIFPKINKTAGGGVLDGPFAWGSEPKRAYNAALFPAHEAHVIIKTQGVFIWVLQ